MNKFNQKGIAHLGLIVLVLALLIAGTAGFIVFNRSDDNGLAQYKDDVGRFTLKYPKDLRIEIVKSIPSHKIAYVGSSILVDSRPGGASTMIDTSTCTIDESTGKTQWLTPLEPNDPRQGDTCPYLIYHKSTKLRDKAYDNRGEKQSLYLVNLSVGGEYRDYNVCIILGPVVENKKLYGYQYVQPKLETFLKSGGEDRQIRACLANPGKSENFFSENSVQEATRILETFRLY